MKRALVSCAALAMLGAGACGSGSNPTLPPGVPSQDGGGASERGASLPPDLRPPAKEVGVSDTITSRDGVDAPLGSDAFSLGIDTGPPSVVSVTILSPAFSAGIDGGASLDGGGAAAVVIASTDRLAPSVRVGVQSRGGDPTADAIVQVRAVLVGEKAAQVASVTLNQTQYEVLPETGSKVSFYGDTPLDLSKVSGGYYDLNVVALTAGGVSGSASVRVYVDAGPVISFLQPVDGVFVKGSVVVTAIVTDSRADVTSVQFSVGQTQLAPALVSTNGAQFTATLDFGSFNPPLDGPQVITVTATNSNGIVTLASRKFTVDNEGPVITGTKPAMGELIGKLITVQATVSDQAGVMEGSVIAVVAHGDVHFEVKLEKAPDGSFRHAFDTAQLPVHTIFPSISFRAQDVLGNQSAVGYLVSLDNTPPVLDLDPPANFRLYKQDGTCSWPFDPVGPDAIDNGSVVNQLFDIRARIEDEGNTPLTGIPDFVPIATVEPTSVKVLILDDTSLPLVVDTSDPPDGICDDINPELVPSVAPQSSKDAQLMNMVSMPVNTGAGDFTYQPGVSCSGMDTEPPKALCNTTYSQAKSQVMTYSLGYATSQPAIWTVPPIVADGLQCAGRQFDASNNLHDGWACVAAVASDKVGNAQVSRPIRICVAAQPGSTACTAAANGAAGLASILLPSSPAGNVVVTTKTALLGVGGAAVAKGDTLVFSDVGPAAVAVVAGDQRVAPLGTTGTQFELSDLAVAPFELWVDKLDGSQPTPRGPVGLLFTDGADLQVGTDSSLTVLDPDFVGAVILVAKGTKVTSDNRRWVPTNITATGFTLRSSATTLSGFVTPAAKLPNCTGTVIKDAKGGPAKVDGTLPCRPWKSFPEFESKLL